MTITFDEQIAVRVAISRRRNELLTFWLGAPVTDRAFWAERLVLLNDAEIKIRRAINEVEIAAWEESRREPQPSTNQLMDALYASLAGGAR